MAELISECLFLLLVTIRFHYSQMADGVNFEIPNQGARLDRISLIPYHLGVYQRGYFVPSKRFRQIIWGIHEKIRC